MRRATMFLCVALLVLSSAPSGGAQTARSLLLYHFDDEPLNVEKGDYDQTENWLRSLSLLVRNTSSKPIFFAEFEVTLRGVRVAGQPAMLKLRFGSEEFARKKATGDGEKSIGPSKTVRLKLPADQYEELLQRMRSEGLRMPSMAGVRLRVVGFGDGTRWQDGHFLQ